MRYSLTYLLTGHLIFECEEVDQMTQKLKEISQKEKNLDMNDFIICDYVDHEDCPGQVWLDEIGVR